MSEFENENGRIAEIDAPASAREKDAGFDADVVENAEIAMAETPSPGLPWPTPSMNISPVVVDQVYVVLPEFVLKLAP